MKKILVLLALLAVLVACSPAQETVTEDVVQEPVEEQVVDAPVEVQVTEMNEEMLNLAKALEMGQSVKCTTTFEGQTSVTYWKNENMRMDTDAVDAHAIYTEDVIYTWTEKHGVMMKMSDIEGMANNTETQQPIVEYETKEDIAAKDVDMTCEPFDVPDSMFVPPDDVEFQDMSELFKQLEGMSFPQ